MNRPLPLPNNQKLLITFRVEAGCLGPEGHLLIVDFCRFAQVQFQQFCSDFIVWDITPRDDKALPELQYSLMNKKLSHKQAQQYLLKLGKDLDDLEGDIYDKLEAQINDYMSSK